MPTKLNSFTLPDNVVQKMKRGVLDSKTKNIEIGFNLCSDKQDHLLVLHDEKSCSGEECTLNIPKGCNRGEHVGLFHTHVTASSKPSILDIANAYSIGINCIGSIEERNIKCYVRKDTTPTRENIASIVSSMITYEYPLLSSKMTMSSKTSMSSKMTMSSKASMSSKMSPEEDIENYRKWTRVRNELTKYYLDTIDVA